MATGMALCAVTAGSQSPIKAIECVCIELLITSRLLGQEVTWPETRSRWCMRKIEEASNLRNGLPDIFGPGPSAFSFREACLSFEPVCKLEAIQILSLYSRRLESTCLRGWENGSRQNSEPLARREGQSGRAIGGRDHRSATTVEAWRCLRFRSFDRTGLRPTVHEAYLRLVDAKQPDWKSRSHFFGVAARLMRQILVDRARSRFAQKRGGRALKVSIQSAEIDAAEPGYQTIDLLGLDLALRELTDLDQEQGRLVELRFFGGMTIEETAEVLGVSPRTVKRHWRLAKAWLRRRLSLSSG
jgi:RNA polymerase sigma factor (TIGR02999 family)